MKIPELFDVADMREELQEHGMPLDMANDLAHGVAKCLQAAFQAFEDTAEVQPEENRMQIMHLAYSTLSVLSQRAAKTCERFMVMALVDKVLARDE